MHIPQHALDPVTCAATGAISAAAVSYAIYRVRGEMPGRKLPLMVLTGAAIFAAQMLNIPVAAGSSGHFLGGALAAILLGPWAGMLVMAAVITLQCVLLGDGGLFPLGANILNMAVIGGLTGHFVYARLINRFAGITGIAAAAAAGCSVLASVSACSIELSVGAGYPFASTLAAMFSVHSLIAIGEGIVTATVVAPILKRPSYSLLYNWRKAAIAIACVLLVAALIRPLASSLPDGLETVLSEAANASRH